jgi:hypothetical protein
LKQAASIKPNTTRHATGSKQPSGARAKVAAPAKTARTADRIAQRILRAGVGQTREEAAKKLGVEPWDIKNLQAGNAPGLVVVLRLVRRGRYSPHALILKNKLEKLPAGVPVHKATAELISERVRQLAKSEDARALARSTGLSINTIYQQRVANKRAGLHTVLGFISAGVSPNLIFFGTP